MVYYDTATRAQALTLKVLGIPGAKIESITGIPPRTTNRILDKAIQMDLTLHPRNQSSWIYMWKMPLRQGDHVSKKLIKTWFWKRSGLSGMAGRRPVLELQQIGSISAMTVWRILKKAGLRKTKPTRKPGLTKQMRAERLAWCQAHSHWTLEDWKRVIWSDETSVVLNHRRGGYRIWRTPEEKLCKSCIRERWKGYSEFMF